jgi:hypothetical protein
MTKQKTNEKYLDGYSYQKKKRGSSRVSKPNKRNDSGLGGKASSKDYIPLRFQGGFMQNNEKSNERDERGR